ncbi:MAG: TRZ/ATZ family hydrolase [Halieaceae bacterium]|jgi:5-methylthioadenosine/S-adenosylhomocysteine deaminase|nr:TRZ/ATZ family hydrolase [Halieaceae bacterium]
MPIVDTLIRPAHIVPVVPRGQVLSEHVLTITGGRISGIHRREDAAAIEAKTTLDLPHHTLFPGLVNSHGHAAMALLRGFADDLPLLPWLEQHIWPAEAAHVSPEFVADGTDLAMAELIRSGTTCFADMYFFPNVVAERAAAAGLRCQLSFPIFDFPSAWGSDADDYISKGLALRDELKHSELVNVVFGPHAPYTVNEKALAKVAMLANELDLPVHIHLHETAGEVSDSLAQYGQRPLARLAELGLIGPRTQCVHMTALDDDDIALLAETGAHVVHCPESNMKLASGRCPVQALQEAGVNVALGTDSAASNNDLSMPGEMRSAALLAKLGQGDAASLPAEAVLEMATINGAQAMGIHADTGSLEVGKWADLIAVDFQRPETQPLYNPVSQFVYAADASQVTHSWVAGRMLLCDRELTTLSMESILRQAGQWRDTIVAAEASRRD